MFIRKENDQDFNAVFALIKSAFASAELSDGKEHDLVTALRGSAAFLPELALVAETDGRIVGHILFTKIDIGGQTELALAPLAVLPGYQGKGVGTALIKKGHEIAKKLGYHYSVVLGSETYYPRCGYLPASEFGILAPFEVPDKNFMAIRLREDAPPVGGVVKYAPEFGI